LLQKDSRKKLRERNWKDIARKDTNLSGTLARFKRQSDDAIRDLTLLANKLPNEEQESIFDYENIQALIEAILQANNEGLHSYSKANDKSVVKGDNRDYDNRFNSRITHTAALLVREGVKFCIDQYKSKLEQDSRLNQATIDKLNDAAEICDAIAFKLHSRSTVESTSSNKEKLFYLFNWDKVTSTNSDSPDDISGEDNRLLFQFIKDKLGDSLNKWVDGRPFEINEIRIKKREFYDHPGMKNYRDISCDIIRRTDEIIRSHLRLDYSKNIVKLTISDITGFTKAYGKAIGPVEEELTAKRQYGNYYIYSKKTSTMERKKDRYDVST
jgi:hypothetical protein